MDNPLARDLDHILEHTEPLWAGARGARIFITGGTGFVGTWITESLLWANRRLGLDLSAVLLTRNPDAFRRRSPHLAGDPAVTLLTGEAASFPWPGWREGMIRRPRRHRAFLRARRRTSDRHVRSRYRGHEPRA